MPRSRRGVIYLAVLILSAVGLIGGVVYHTVMQQGRRQAYRSLTGEYAAMMARGGLAIAQGYLARELRDPASDLFQALTRPLSAYAVGTDAVTIGGPVKLDEELPALTDALARDLPDGRSGLSRLEARFYLMPAELHPLPAWPLGGRLLPRGEEEKSGTLFVEVTAGIGFAILSRGVERSVRAAQQFRVAHGPLPLLSDFTLFLKEVPAPGGPAQATPVNVVEATERGLLAGATGAVPVVLGNGAAGKRQALAGDMNREFFRKQGLVYLGGDGVTLNLTYSQEESTGDQSVGEDFHFFQANPANPDAGRAVVDEGARTRANRHLGQPFWEVRNWDMGVHTLRGGPLETEYQDVFRGEPEGHRLGSLLKLYGAAPDRISPTVVLGDVSAGFLRIAVAAAANNASGSYDAYYTVLEHQPRSAAGFLAGMYGELQAIVARLLYDDNPRLSGKWAFMSPDITSVLLPMASGASEDDYQQLCSGFHQRNYNEGLLYLKARNESSSVTSKVGELGLPSSLFGAGPDRSRMPGELLPADLSALSGVDLERVLLEELAPALKAAAHRHVPAGQPPEAFLAAQGMLDAGGVLDLGTVVWTDQPLTLPAITGVLRGGVIIARELKLSGGVTAGVPGAPAVDPRQRLVLIATDGGITLPAGGAPVEASLVALKGAVVPQGAFHVQGNLVARRFDFGPLASGTGTAKLDYDRSLKERPAAAAAAGSLLVDWERRWVRVD